MVSEQLTMKSGYKQTEVGIIPEDWNVNEYSELTKKITYGFTNPMPTTNHGMWMITATNIKNGKIIYKNARKTSLDAYNNLITSKSRPKKGFVLITKDGTVGEVAIVDKKNICINQSVASIEPNTSKMSSEYLLLTFQSNFVKQLIEIFSPNTTIRHIYITDIPKWKIAYPSHTEQQKIILNLSDTNELIQQLNYLITKKKNIKWGVMQELLTGKRRLNGFSGEWKITSFDKIFLKIPTKNFQIKTSKYQDSGKYPIIDQGKEKIIGFTDNEKKVFSCPIDGIIIFGDHTREIKFVNENFVIGADGTQIISTKNKSDVIKFFFYQIKIKNIPNTGYNRHFKFLLEYEYFQPTQKEQMAIAKILSDMDSEIQELEEKRDKYINIKNGMMQKLLTGEIRLT